MSPRAYKLGKREAAATETRSRILDAAREILADESGTADLSMDAIARAHAGTVTVESTVEHGTTFRVTWPL